MHIAERALRAPLTAARLGLICAWLLAAAPIWAGGSGTNDPRAWVARMNQALASRNYDGVFVLQLGARRETLRIIHRVQDGKMSERLVSTDGSGREFIRKGGEWVAYFPDRKIVVVERRGPGGFISGLHGLGTDAEKFYDIRAMETVRMQGRPTRVITVTPRDNQRYGYKFWIDESTAMPVRTRLSTAGEDVIEEITFVSLTLPATIDDELLKPDADATGFRWLRRDTFDATRVPTQRFAPRVDLLPPGFRLSGVLGGHSSPDAAKSDPKAGKPRARFIVTDGMAWVSVFIEPADVPPQPSRDGTPRRADGPAQMGASAAFTARIEGHRVTAVGEVPPATVKAIAESVRPE